MKTLGKLTLDVPPAAPVEVIAQAVPVAPVRVSKTFASFVDELDGDVPDMAPSMFQAHTATYEVEPLPWDRDNAALAFSNPAFDPLDESLALAPAVHPIAISLFEVRDNSCTRMAGDFPPP